MVAKSIVACLMQWNCCGVPLTNCIKSFHKALLKRITIEKLQGGKKRSVHLDRFLSFPRQCMYFSCFKI